MNSNNICLKIWNLYYQWAGIWKAHWMGIRIGNFDLQRDSLSAAGPLYASAAKSNYTTAIAHFLATIAAHPQLEEKLRYCGAFKIPYDAESDPENVRHVCFGFDEALETFGYITDSSQSSQKNTDENLNEQHLSDAAKPQSKQKKHRTTDEETNILSVLKVYKDKLPDDAIASVCNQLSEVWTKKKVRDWWNYHKDK
ncbi:unnamed protein product [Rhizophagus irregularis]|nr:unnamed protein product [Rhizophagus irregularis]